MHDDYRTDAERIAARMEWLRSDMDRKLENVSRSTRRLTDWRFYVRQTPRLIPSAAVAFAYFLRTLRATQTISMAPVDRTPRLRGIGTAASATLQSTVVSIATGLLGIAATVAARSATDFIGRRLRSKLARRQVDQPLDTRT